MPSTRGRRTYDTPYQKAEMGNEAGADYFVSLHRNAANEPGKGSGVMTLVYAGGEAEQLADSVQKELARTGYADLGVIERPDLIVLRKTQMPAVLVEAGFIDNPEDNKRFDAQFDEIAAAVASGILNAMTTWIAVRWKRETIITRSRRGRTASDRWQSSS